MYNFLRTLSQRVPDFTNPLLMGERFLAALRRTQVSPAQNIFAFLSLAVIEDSQFVCEGINYEFCNILPCCRIQPSSVARKWRRYIVDAKYFIKLSPEGGGMLYNS